MTTHTHCDKCGEQVSFPVRVKMESGYNGPNESFDLCKDCAYAMMPDHLLPIAEKQKKEAAKA